MTTDRRDWIGIELSGGRYRVQDQLGKGGMATVYRAHDVHLDADVCIKVPRRAVLSQPGFADRFAREVRSLVELAHPHVVRILDVGQHKGTPFAVLQYLSGGTLQDRQREQPDGAVVPVPATEIIRWIAGIADALDFVHKHGYIHRDVKPSNILFDRGDNAYLSDFGVIKALSDVTTGTSAQAMTAAGLILGTPEYLAPELIMGNPPDGRADQYALAVTVYELLCGKRPFEGPTPSAILVQQANQTPPSLSVQLPTPVGRHLNDVVHRGMAKDPRERFATCAAFAESLTNAVKSCPASVAIANVLSGTAGAARVRHTVVEPVESTYSLAPSLETEQARRDATKALRAAGPTTRPVTRKKTRREEKSMAAWLIGAIAMVVSISLITVALMTSKKTDALRPDSQNEGRVAASAAGLDYSPATDPENSQSDANTDDEMPEEQDEASDVDASQSIAPRQKALENEVQRLRNELADMRGKRGKPANRQPIAAQPKSGAKTSAPPGREKEEENALADNQAALQKQLQESERRARVAAAVVRGAPLPLLGTTVEAQELIQIATGRSGPKKVVPPKQFISLPKAGVTVTPFGATVRSGGSQRMETPESKLRRAAALQQYVAERQNYFSEKFALFRTEMSNRANDDPAKRQEIETDLKGLTGASQFIRLNANKADVERFVELVSEFAVKHGDASNISARLLEPEMGLAGTPTGATPPADATAGTAASTQNQPAAIAESKTANESADSLRRKAKQKRTLGKVWEIRDPRKSVAYVNEAEALERQAASLEAKGAANENVAKKSP